MECKELYKLDRMAEVDIRTLDLDSIIEKSSETVLTMKDGYHYIRDIDYDSFEYKSAMLYEKLNGEVFRRVVDAVLKDTGESDAMTAEQGVAAMIHAGLDKSRIRFRSMSFTCPLKNCKCKVNKETDGLSVCLGSAGKWTPSTTLPSRLSPVNFASMILQYDDIVIPQIQDATAKLLEELRRQDAVRQQKKLAAEMESMTVRSLIEQFVTPLGIHADFRIRKGKVHIDFSQYLKGEADIPMEELSERLRDAAAVLSLLKPHELPDEDAPSRRFGRNPFIIGMP